MCYVNLWDRTARTLILILGLVSLTILLVGVTGLFIKYEHHVGMPLWLCATSISFIIYVFFRHKFAHITLTDRGGNRINFTTHVIRLMVDLVPFLLVYGFYVVGNLSLVNYTAHTHSRSVIADIFLHNVFLIPFTLSLFLVWWALPILFTKARRSLSDIIVGTYVVFSNKEGISAYGLKSCMRIVVKAPFYIMAVIFLAGIVLINVLSIYYLKDEKITPEVSAFFAPDPINIENNFFIALSGIYAPSEEVDLYSFGVKVYQGEIDRKAAKRLRFQNDIRHDKRHCIRQNSYYKYDDLNADNLACYTSEELNMLYTQNEPLILRYKNLLKNTPNLLVSVGGQNNVGVASMQDILAIQSLLLDVWIIQAKEEQGEVALKEWITNMRALQHIISGKLGLSDYMIWTIVYSRNINALPAILEIDPVLLSKYGDVLRDVLDFDYMGHWNVAEILRAEWNLSVEMEKQDGLRSSILYAPNATRNSLYELKQKIVGLSEISPNNFHYGNEESAPLSQCSLVNFLNCVPHNMIGNLIAGRFEIYHNQFIHAYRMIAKQKEIIIWIDAHMQKILPENMEEFLDNSEVNPISNEPLLWNNDKRYIYYNAPNKRGELQQRTFIYYE